MSYSTEVFPTLPGLKWSIKKTPMFETTNNRALSGREYPVAHRQYPIWRWELSYEVIRDDASNELQSIVGFFLRRRGSFESFRYLDPEINAVTDLQIGNDFPAVGKTYQLLSYWGSFYEPVTDPVAGFTMKCGANAVFGTANIYGVVTLSSGSFGAQGLTWTGSFYQRVRFEEDENEFEKFMEKLWSAQKITFITRRL